jgi:hypothetical protein
VAFHTRASPPSVVSHGEKVQKKRKWTETVDVSESSGESTPEGFPSSSYVDDPFSMAQILSK